MLPQAVCNICLDSDTSITSPDCHKDNTHLLKITACKVSGLNRLLCSEVTCRHKPMQAWFKSHFNPSKGHKNFKAFSVSRAGSRKFSSNVI